MPSTSTARRSSPSRSGTTASARAAERHRRAPAGDSGGQRRRWRRTLHSARRIRRPVGRRAVRTEPHRPAARRDAASSGSPARRSEWSSARSSADAPERWRSARWRGPVPRRRTSPSAHRRILVLEHGSPVSRAERKVLNLRPSNLIWVMPAQGGQSHLNFPCLFPRIERARQCTQHHDTAAASDRAPQDARRCAGGSSTSSSRASSASPSASSSGSGDVAWAPVSAPLEALAPGPPGGSPRHLAHRRRARRADHPQAGRGALHRAASRRSSRRSSATSGACCSRSRPVSCRGSAPNSSSRSSCTAAGGLPVALLAGAAPGLGDGRSTT